MVVWRGVKGLQKKVVLVTGASSGIGRHVAIAAAQRGAKLILVARNTKVLNELAKQLAREYHTQSLVITCDMRQSKQIESAVKKALNKFETVDYLVNCAGYGSFQLASDMSYDEMLEMFEVNTLAMMYLTQLLLPSMLKSKSGHIIFVASIAGKIPTPFASVYSATKGAIINYARALRMEVLDKGIGVTVVNPGPVDTAFFQRDTSTQQYGRAIASYMISPEKLAEKIVNILSYQPNRRELNVPFSMATGAFLLSLAPKCGEYIIRKCLNFKGESL